MESLRGAVRFALDYVGSLAVRVSGKPEIPSGMRRNRGCPRSIQMDLLAEHRWKPGLVSGNFIFAQKSSIKFLRYTKLLISRRFFQVKTLQEKSKDKSTRSLKLHKRKDLKVLLKEVRDLTTALCKSPYLRNTLLACGIQFGLTSSYYTLMVWFPELFTRYIIFRRK